mmetsp:Transcript_111/g.143  ORF Transcript_111/g.143 Transcript_111/m.143 type:complete len:449 (+) Transcript_111:84-1430(+)|eukprot:CAMPEP_0184028942 /NCGR_PEP_ID=MMETSP0954-20121128/15138_1 /TAXON_ID=627963 /ORGANISM="Aplanochytrium sp, Strain PBS07" /LENGTH=448 /DNA_ID=CAMNT_0026313877 /DNA_START=90 /DNA_END=1436 /DNA_ORIENTATION=+
MVELKHLKKKLVGEKKPTRGARCCRALKFFLLALTTFIVLVAVVFRLLPDNPLVFKSKVFLMRFFRNVARAKARGRLQNNEKGLLAMTFGDDVPETVPDLCDIESLPSMTAEELGFYDGTNDRPIYLAVKGRVYDVSEGKAFYGKGRSYYHFVAKDATRAFATGCVQKACLVSSLEGLSADEKMEADRWIEFFEFHDKYKLVASLEEDVVERILEETLIEEAKVRKQKQTSNSMPNQLFKAGLKRYNDGDYKDADGFWAAAMIKLGEAKSNETRETMQLRSRILSHQAALEQKRENFVLATNRYDEALESVKNSFDNESGMLLSDIAATVFADRGIANVRQGNLVEAASDLEMSNSIYENIILNTSDELEEKDYKEIYVLHANLLLNFAMVKYELNNIEDANKKLENLESLYGLTGIVRKKHNLSDNMNHLLNTVINRAQHFRTNFAD